MQAHIVTNLELTAHGNYKEWIANINSTLLNLTAMVGSSPTLLEMFLGSKSIKVRNWIGPQLPYVRCMLVQK